MGPGLHLRFTATRLYALDVAGGCVAAFVAVPFVVPLYGMAALGVLAAIPCVICIWRVQKI